jgi:hypothetical protein
MGYNIGPTIAINGEREYNEAMKNIRREMKYLSAEADAVTSAYDKNDKSIDALTANNKEMRKAYDLQRNAVKAAEDALERMKANGVDPSSKAFKDMTANLNKAQASLNKTEREIKDNESALQNASVQGKGFGDVIGNLTSKLGINLPAGATESTNSVVKMSGSMATAAIGAAAFAVALYKVAEAAVKMTLEQSKAADELLTTAAQTGIAVSTLQELAYAQELVDVSLDTMTGSMARNIRSMNSARNGSKELLNVYRDLHVQITDGNGRLRDSEEVYWDVIEALGKVKNETERDAYAMQLFGKSAQDLNPLIKMGADGLEEFRQEARESGYVMSDEMVMALGSVDDSIQYFNNSMTAAKNTLSGALAPAVSGFIDEGSDLVQVLGEIVDESGLDDFLSVIITSGSGLLKSLEPLMEILGPLVGETLKPIALALGIVADALTIVASVLGIIIESVKWLIGQSPNAGAKIAGYWQNIAGVFTGQGATTAALKMYGIGNNADGTDNWRGGLTWVGERGPELLNLPRGSAVYSNQQSMAMAGNVYVTIDAKNVREFNDVVRIAQNARITQRAGVARR